MYVCVSAIPCVYMYAMRAYAHTYVMHLYLYTCIYVYTRMGAFALVLVCVSFSFRENRGCPVRNADPSPIMEIARRHGVTTFKGGGRKRRGICATILSSACVCIGTYPLHSQVATRVGKSACADYWRL